MEYKTVGAANEFNASEFGEASPSDQHIGSSRPYAQFTFHEALRARPPRRCAVGCLLLTAVVIAIVVTISVVVRVTVDNHTSPTPIPSRSKCPSGSSFLAAPAPVNEDPCPTCSSLVFTCCTPGVCANQFNFASLFQSPSGSCQDYLEQLSCAVCDGNASPGDWTEPFNVSSTTAPPMHLCKSYCKSVWSACLDTTVACGTPPCHTVRQLYPSYSDLFCSGVLSTDETRVVDCYSHADSALAPGWLAAAAIVVAASALWGQKWD